MFEYIFLFITIIIIIFIIYYIFSIIYSPKNIEEKFSEEEKCSEKFSENKCKAKTCGAIDPVSNPDYNMKQIIKQSILLEEHLIEVRKRCRDCIIKHFLHIQGLHEEALMLAGDNASKYPLLVETTDFYNDKFNEWLKSEEYLKTAEELREMRKKLVAEYY